MKIKLIIPIIIMLFMTACSQVITDIPDEIRLNSWSTKLENESVVSLSFEGDNAKFTVKSSDKDASVSIEGLCSFDNKNLMIYNKKDAQPYFFKYKLNNDKLVLKYDGGAIRLSRVRN